MRFVRLATLMTSLDLFFLALLAVTSAPNVFAQSMLTGGLTGTVIDPSGAAIPNAKVTAQNTETGATSVATSSAGGAYRFSLLKPGPYTVSATASGFEKASTSVTIAVGQMASQDLRLKLGEASQTIEVTAAPQLLQTDTAQLSTTVNLQQIQNIPNPGSDITYEAQAKPGVVMNTGANSSSGTLGYGNFSAFGLPGTSNNFTVNGMEVNDPFLNLNNSGPSNLLLGLNDIQETDVVTNAYEVQYGTLAGVQLNSITRSGSNKFHGNLNYGWNGRVLNSNDWFNKSSAPVVPRPFSNFNQWAAAVGGPIRK
ncbi:MAG TPA: carboxypeptidase-like regulatory domain-containing protein, partial [Terracidiphilus sp.]|nr:carboxypeptidase-like regulatory domain-containing protein [Terracidiphilus sp.]